MKVCKKYSAFSGQALLSSISLCFVCVPAIHGKEIAIVRDAILHVHVSVHGLRLGCRGLFQRRLKMRFDTLHPPFVLEKGFEKIVWYRQNIAHMGLYPCAPDIRADKSRYFVIHHFDLFYLKPDTLCTLLLVLSGDLKRAQKKMKMRIAPHAPCNTLPSSAAESCTMLLQPFDARIGSQIGCEMVPNIAWFSLLA